MLEIEVLSEISTSHLNQQQYLSTCWVAAVIHRYQASDLEVHVVARFVSTLHAEYSKTLGRSAISNLTPVSVRDYF
jgi:hypothetical protein